MILALVLPLAILPLDKGLLLFGVLDPTLALYVASFVRIDNTEY